MRNSGNNEPWQKRMKRGYSDHWNRDFSTDVSRSYGRNTVRTRGGERESDDHLPYQRESIYTQFRGDPEKGFVHLGIKNTDPLRIPGNFTGKGPKGYRRSDERIHEEVCELLTLHPQIDPSDIHVQVNRNIVTLTGTVLSRRMKALVEDVIEEVIGIDDIENLLQILGRTNDPDRDQIVKDKIGRSNLRFGAVGSPRDPDVDGM